MNEWAAPMGAGVGVHTHHFTEQYVPDPDDYRGFVKRWLCSCGELGHEITEEKMKRLQERGDVARKGRKVVVLDIESQKPIAAFEGDQLAVAFLRDEAAIDPNRATRLAAVRYDADGLATSAFDLDDLPVTPLDPPSPRLSDSDLFSRYVLKELEDELRALWGAERGARAIWGSNPSVEAGRLLSEWREAYRLLNGVRRRARLLMGGGRA